MVTLAILDYEYESELEKELNKANIEYQLVLDMGHYGIKPPHLIVDGVPLDYKRSLKWIRGHGKNE